LIVGNKTKPAAQIAAGLQDGWSTLAAAARAAFIHGGVVQAAI
jgi:hypothetical protein